MFLLDAETKGGFVSVGVLCCVEFFVTYNSLYTFKIFGRVSLNPKPLRSMLAEGRAGTGLRVENV